MNPLTLVVVVTGFAARLFPGGDHADTRWIRSSSTQTEARGGIQNRKCNPGVRVGDLCWADVDANADE